MSKLIRITVAFHLVLACIALALGLMLFNKREEMKGRTLALEDAFVALASTLEDGAAEPVRLPGLPERDLDAVDSLVENPERARFWHDYPAEMEQQDHSTMDLSRRRGELMRYYRIDPITLKIVRDPVSGEKLTHGPHTMQSVLDDVVAQGEEQYNRLNRTREQLGGLRRELVNTIADSNGTKERLRVANHTIRDRDSTVAHLQDTVADRDASLQLRREEIAALKRDVSDVGGELMRSEDNVAQLSDDVKKLKFELARVTGGEGAAPGQRWAALTRGEKGRVVAVDPEWHFVVLHFSEEFISQYVRLAEFSKEDPDPKLSVMRDMETDGKFVTMVQLCWVNPKERLGVANILSAWEQTAVVPGDTIVY